MDSAERDIAAASRAPAPARPGPRPQGNEGSGLVRLSLMVHAVFGALVAIDAPGAPAQPLAGGGESRAA